MIKVKLPFEEQEIANGKLKRTKKELEVQLDFSIYAETRWEKNFPEQAEREGLFEYVERLENIRKSKKNNVLQREIVISMIKAVYCFIDSELTFKEFSQMISIAQPTFIKKLIEIMELALESSAEKN